MIMRKLLLMILTFVLSHVSWAKDYNFVVLLADDLGWADVSPNNPRTNYETPNIQKLADEGVNFPQAYAPNPVCSPSRFGLQTGKYPTRGGVTNWIGGGVGSDSKFLDALYNKNGMSEEEIGIAKILRAHGYKTFIAGKWHLRGDIKAHGYDESVGVGCFGKKPNPKKYFGPFNDEKLKDKGENDYLPDLLTDETVKFINENKDNKFFVFRSFFLVHSPHYAPENLVKKYTDKFIKMGIIKANDGKNVPEKTKTQCHPTYAAMMESLDSSIGRIIKAIDDNNLADKTVIIFASDNGGAVRATSNLPLRSGKGFTYEGGVRVPIIIKIPDFNYNKDACKETIVSLLDLYPTICELADIKFDHKIDGVSIIPALKGDKDFKHPDLFWDFPHYRGKDIKPSGGIRSGDWKLIENYADGSIELYNIKDDIGENTDLASKYPEIVAELKKKLHVWYKDVDAKFLRPNPKFPNEKLWRPE